MKKKNIKFKAKNTTRDDFYLKLSRICSEQKRGRIDGKTAFRKTSNMINI